MVLLTLPELLSAAPLEQTRALHPLIYYTTSSTSAPPTTQRPLDGNSVVFHTLLWIRRDQWIVFALRKGLMEKCQMEHEIPKLKICSENRTNFLKP
ncbi:hypothetical protein QQF64_033146, partial [Cirrhinus molitorella]